MDTSTYGQAGAELVAAVLAQMAEDDLEPDARDRSLLDTAARLADRMAALDVMIEADGERSVSDTGIVRLHPGIAEFRQHSIALSKVLVAVALVESNGVRKDPAKVRAVSTLVGAQPRQGRTGGVLMARKRMPDVATALTVREALIAKLSTHERQTFDPRWVLVRVKEWPSPMPPYVDPLGRMLDLLEAGEPVDVWPHLLRGVAEVPPGCRLVRVEVDGTLHPNGEHQIDYPRSNAARLDMNARLLIDRVRVKGGSRT